MFSHTEEADRKKMKQYKNFLRLSSLNFKGIEITNGGLKNIPRYIASSIFRFTSPQLWNLKLEAVAKKYNKVFKVFYSIRYIINHP